MIRVHRTLAILGLTGMIAGAAGAATGSHGSKDMHKAPSLVCPVMGTKIASVKDAVGKSVYKGKTYYFCCPGCKPMFDKTPEKYVQKMKTAKGAPGAH